MAAGGEGAAVDRAGGDFLDGRPSGLHGVPLSLRGGGRDTATATATLPADGGHGLAVSLRRLARDMRKVSSPGVRGASDGMVDARGDVLSTYEVRS